jgi:hypothetical protein
LEPSESQALSEHLANCPECGAELAKARAEQKLVAEAARLDFIIPPFVAPSVNSQRVISGPLGAGKHRNWQGTVPWLAAAAAILLSIVLPQVIYTRGLAERERALAAAKASASDIEAKHERLSDEARLQPIVIERQIRDNQLQVQLFGPADIEPDQAGRYLVRTTNGNGQPSEVLVAARLRDEKTKQVLFETKEQLAPGEWRFDLPHGLATTPGTTARLEVVARDRDRTESIDSILGIKRPAYLTHLAIDGHVYQPGEIVLFRSLTVSSRDLKPPKTPLAVKFNLISRTTETPVLDARTQEGGISGGEFVIPPSLPDGEYTLAASDPERRFSQARRRFFVSRRKKTEASNAAQTPGDKSLDVEFYPEGGSLTPNVPNRVYFRVRDRLGRPAEFRGRLVDQNAHEVAKVETRKFETFPSSLGLGVLSLTPRAGERYSLESTDAAWPSVEGQFPRPSDLPGYAFSLPDSVGKQGEPVRVVLRRPKGESRPLVLAVFNRDRLTAFQKLPPSTEGECRIALPKDCAGVVRVTLLERQGAGLRAVAERLAYRIPNENLQLVTSLKKDNPRPGEQVSLQIRGSDAKGTPTAGWLHVSVVDQSLLNRAGDCTEQSPRALFYLTSELDAGDELEHADSLVRPELQAAEALDLVLGTYGWRSLGPWEDLKLATAVVFKDNQERMERKAYGEITSALAKLKADLAQQESRLHAEGQATLRELKLAGTGLRAYESETPRLIGGGTVLVALVSLLIGGLYIAAAQRGGIALPRPALAGVLAGLVVGLTGFYWFTGMSSRSDSDGGGEQIARFEQKLGAKAIIAMPAPKPSHLAPIRDNRAPTDRPTRVRPSGSRRVTDKAGTVSTKEDAKKPSPVGAELSTRPLREYAPFRLADKPPPPDVPETIYWHPTLFAADGNAQVKVDLPSSAGRYRVRIDGHDADGRFGSTEFQLETQANRKDTKSIGGTDSEKK